mgnify:CR=1 FL=1
MKRLTKNTQNQSVKTTKADQFLTGEKNNFLQNGNAFFPDQHFRSQTKANSSGQKLPIAVLGKMQNVLSEDFSGVEIYTDSEFANSLNAQAFTYGNKISFAPGRYNPHSKDGLELIGHELTHVLQQRKSPGSQANNGERNANVATAEKEANHTGKAAANGNKTRLPKTSVKLNKPVIQRKGNEGSNAGNYVATGADKTNATTNILGGIIDRFTKKLEGIEKLAKEAGKEAAAAKRFALTKAAAAKKAVQAAGSGKSKALSKLASKAAQEANEARKLASIKQMKALRLLEEAQKVRKLLPVAIKVLNKLPLNTIGFAASAINKYLTTSNVTTAGKVVDSGITAGFDLAFGMSHPVASAIDAVIGLIPGGERFNISNTMSNSINSITGSAESIVTGDISGIERFYQDSKAGKNTWIMEQAANAGDFWSEHGGAERTRMVGDFWGGVDTITGRSTAFLAAMPGIGHLGEGLGWLAFQGYDKGGDALNFAGDKLSELDQAIMPEGRTLNPVTGIKSLLNGENPFW